jgi:hypothetical protein
LGIKDMFLKVSLAVFKLMSGLLSGEGERGKRGGLSLQ